jgi:hypothetical protein
MKLEFPSKENPKLAEFVGILLGDGSIGIYECKSGGRTRIQHKLQISTNSVNDKEYILYLERTIEELFGIKPKKFFRKGENTCDVRLFHRDIIKFVLNDVGMMISPKWKRAKIPEFYLNNELELLVLRGYLDTDGCVTITNNNGILYPQIEMKICPSPMQNQFIDILKRRGFRFQVNDIGKGKVRIRLNGKKQVYKWNKEIGFSNPKHAKKLLNFNALLTQSTAPERFMLAA